MASKAVAKQAKASVPDLVQTPALEIGMEDVVLPRIKLGQFTSDAVKDQLVKPGCLFSSLSKDDMNPVTLWEPGDEPGLIFHVLALKRGRSMQDPDTRELILYDYDDPDAPAATWVTYNYTVAVPGVADDVPYNVLFTKTGKGCALQINTVLKRAEGKTPPHGIAFELKTAKRQRSQTESYFVPVVKQVEATGEGLEIANNLAIQMSGMAAELGSSGDEPAI